MIEAISGLEEFLAAFGLSFSSLFKIIVFPGFIFISLLAMMTIWFERKFWSKVQMRYGPLHVGKYAGILQLVADFIKLLTKEIIIPRKADKFLFLLAPVLICSTAVIPLMVIPFDKEWVIYKMDYSLLFFIAVYSLYPVAIIAASWASNNKYSFIGGIRAALQVFVYEIPLFLALLSAVMLLGTFNLIEIVEAQSSVWLIALQPLSFALFLVALLAELERTPFDIPEAEQELMVGWMVEYTGILYGLLIFANYIKLCIGAFIITAVFLGGWLGPAFLPPVIWFLLKAFVVIVLISLAKAILPRFRIDQLLEFGWKFLIPIAILNIGLSSLIAIYIKPIFIM